MSCRNLECPAGELECLEHRALSLRNWAYLRRISWRRCYLQIGRGCLLNDEERSAVSIVGGVTSAIVNETSALCYTGNDFILNLPIWGGRIKLFSSKFAPGASSHTGLVCVISLQSTGEVGSLLGLWLWSRYAPMFTIGAIHIVNDSYDDVTQVLYHEILLR